MKVDAKFTLEYIIIALLLSAIIGLLQIWLIFWAIDELFHYYIPFTFWNVLAAVILFAVAKFKIEVKRT